jgi:hypothetical protein
MFYRNSVVTALLFAVASLGGVALAGARWSNEATPTVRVHEHTFDKVGIEADGCTLALRLHFDAPAVGYGDSRNPGRNEYRFAADVQLKNGEKLTTPEFINRKAGRRLYRKEFDTTTDGCWAKQPNKIIKLDVDACRGHGCAVERTR